MRNKQATNETQTGKRTMKSTTTYTVQPSGDEFLVISPSGNVHSVVATLADAEALARRVSQNDRQRRSEYSY